MIRSATIHDLKIFVAIAKTETKHFPWLRPDTSKIKNIIVECVSSKQHYAKLIGRQGEVVSVLIAYTLENVWAEKRCSNVMLWLSLVGGEGVKLLRDYRNWVNSRPVLRFAGFDPQIDWSPRTSDLLIHTGFQKYGGSFLVIK